MVVRSPLTYHFDAPLTAVECRVQESSGVFAAVPTRFDKYTRRTETLTIRRGCNRDQCGMASHAPNHHRPALSGRGVGSAVMHLTLLARPWGGVRRLAVLDRREANVNKGIYRSNVYSHTTTASMGRNWKIGNVNTASLERLYPPVQHGAFSDKFRTNRGVLSPARSA